ncbi:AbrB family transcriptional regulator [Holdemania massiliensis]|uniref:AbrB family transcriptional regulator n=1 Tax=Holdemania massiliensis TaxID=1468449 RepID=UPI001F06945C|nr:AbrB family transcriptional regulator [Holdemania massiliensis]MCH1942646.1 AbrB family transcriptional regulator [Holdemania massiliensis]
MIMKCVLTLAVGTLGWTIARKLKIPAPAMIGSMLAVGILNMIFDFAWLPLVIKNFTQGIAGTFIGMQLKIEDLRNIKKLAKPILLLVLMFTLNTFVVGIAISIICKMDLLTALLSCVAGGVTDMSLISMDMGAVTSTVALIQTSRLISALLFFPIWIMAFTQGQGKKSAMEPEGEAKISKSAAQSGKGNGPVTLTAAFLFSYLGSLTPIPAGSLIFAMFGILLLNCTTPLIGVDKRVKSIGQLFAGSLVGVSITRETFLTLPQLILPVLILLVSFWIINFLYAQICVRTHMLDLQSALFASCPAGASDMALIASDLGADLGKIGLIQVIRLVAAVSLMPQLIQIFMLLVS